MTMVTATATLVLLGVSACGTSDPEESEPDPTTSSSSPTADASDGPIDSADDLEGDWQDAEAEWTVHFKADGTYAEDYQDVEDFRVGTYEVEGTTVSLIGDDGNTDKGTIEGDSLKFTLGTLTRK